MGLGKTLIALAAAEKLLNSGKVNYVLIVCPASLKYQWAQQIAQHTSCEKVCKKLGSEEIIIPKRDTCLIVDGTKVQRIELYVSLVKEKTKYIIIGFDNVIYDYYYVGKIKPDMVIIDEATAIKSFRAERSKRIKKILKAKYRMALTGTPVENKPDEVFSIMQWVDDSILGRYDLFDKAYIKRNKNNWIVSYKNLPVLRKKLAPAVSRLRRDDPVAQLHMPKVDEKNWELNISSEMLRVYKTIALDMLQELEKQQFKGEFKISDYYNGVDESKPSGRLMSMYMCLEMLLDHPDLIIWSGMKYADMDSRNGSEYAYSLWQSGLLDHIYDSPKLNLLLTKTEKIAEDSSNKILIFSWHKYMLQIIQDNLDELGIQSVQFHGSMNAVKKAEAKAKFMNNKTCRVFLSSHAGAYGMDMNMANYLINYDLPWSSGKADQINNRHVRTSSSFSEVYIRNLISQGTVEPRKLAILERKRNIASAILDGFGNDDFGRIEMDGHTLRGTLTDALKPGTIVTKG